MKEGTKPKEESQEDSENEASKLSVKVKDENSSKFKREKRQKKGRNFPLLNFNSNFLDLLNNFSMPFLNVNMVDSRRKEKV